MRKVIGFFWREVWPERKQMGWAWWIGCVLAWILIMIGGLLMGPIDKLKALWHLNKIANLWDKTFWRTSQMGWKTIVGSLVVAASGALRFLEAQGVCQGCADMAGGIEALGIAVIGVGLRHALAKGGK